MKTNRFTWLAASTIAVREWRGVFLIGLCFWLSSVAGAQPALTLAKTFSAEIDVRGYWVSEKYDGVRAYWDGKQLYSRQGLPITPPPSFTAGWPSMAMDGELWAGRGAFAQVQATVARAAPDAIAWEQVRYMVFDLPQHSGTFTERHVALKAAVNALQQPWVQAVRQWKVSSQADLQRQLQEFVAAGAEGLMLRRVDAPYRSGRSDDLIKLKLWEDAEAVVIAHLPGKGKYEGLTGALLVRDADGRQFRLGSGLNDAERRNPPPLGSTVTYRFQERHPSGLPRFARYWRIHTE